MSRDGAFDVTRSQVTHEGMLTTLRVDTLRMPDGDTADREIAHRPDAVAMVPVTDAGEVILVRQYRHAVGGYMLEVPAGLLDVDGEDSEDAARRELAEEIGMRADALERALTFHNSSGWTDESTIVYVATGLHDVPRPQDFTAEAEEADMDVVTLPLTEAIAAVQRGEITDAKTVIGLLFVATTGAS